MVGHHRSPRRFPHPEQCQPAPPRERVQYSENGVRNPACCATTASTPHFVRTPIARYPSSFISYCQGGPSGSFSTARQSIGSKNPAFAPIEATSGCFRLTVVI